MLILAQLCGQTSFLSIDFCSYLDSLFTAFYALLQSSEYLFRNKQTAKFNIAASKNILQFIKAGAGQRLLTWSKISIFF